MVATLRKGISIYDIERGGVATVAIARGDVSPSYIPVTFTHEGNQIIAGSFVGKVGLWEVSSGYHSENLSHKNIPVLAIAVR